MGKKASDNIKYFVNPDGLLSEPYPGQSSRGTDFISKIWMAAENSSLLMTGAFLAGYSGNRSGNQGSDQGVTSEGVAMTVKHFPGGAPEKMALILIIRWDSGTYTRRKAFWKNTTSQDSRQQWTAVFPPSCLLCQAGRRHT